MYINFLIPVKNLAIPHSPKLSGEERSIISYKIDTKREKCSIQHKIARVLEQKLTPWLEMGLQSFAPQSHGLSTDLKTLGVVDQSI